MRTLLLLLLASLAVACTGSPRPDDRLHPQPDDIAPAHLVLFRDEPADTDSDGFTDRVSVTTYLFPDEHAYSQPLWIEGEFRFLLLDLDRKPITEWTFTAAEASALQRSAGDLRHYIFRLDLESKIGRVPARSALLQGEFTPKGGTKPLRSKLVALRVGQVR